METKTIYRVVPSIIIFDLFSRNNKHQMYVTIDINDDVYSVVCNGLPTSEDYLAKPDWLMCTDDMSLDEAVFLAKHLNGDSVDHLDNRFFFFDEGNDQYHRTDSHGEPILEGRQMPSGFLSPWNLGERIWIETISSQESE